MRSPSNFARPKTVAIVAAIIWIVLPSRGQAKVYVVNGPHAEASDDNSGTEAKPFQTINRAAQLAQPGDTVLVRAGEYRERVIPAQGGTPGQPIVYTAAPGEIVVIKGSDIWRPQWQKMDVERPIYRGKLDGAMFGPTGDNPFQMPLKGAPDRRRLTLGQVFVDGHPLREVDRDEELTANAATWQVRDRGTSLAIHFPDNALSPQQQVVEVSVRPRIFAPSRRGLGYIHVKGFTMEHCANQFPERFWESDSPQAGALGCRAGHHWLIEGNTVRFAKSIGIDCGYEGRHDLEGRQPTPQNTGQHVIRNNQITDNGCCGIAGMRSLETQILNNIIARNNRNRHTAPEIGGIKVHYFINGRIEGNLIHDNDAHGIWIDNVYRNARVTRNLIVRNHGDGIFVELGEGPILIDNNVIAETLPGYLKRDPRGDGMYSHDASGITFVHNLVFGSDRFGSFHLKATKRRGAGASRIALLNNIFIDNRQGHINLPADGPDARNNQAERNLFSSPGQYLVNPWGGNSTGSLVRKVEKSLERRLELWSDAAPRMNLAEWQRVSGWGLLSAESSEAEARIDEDYVLTLNLGNASRSVNAERVQGLDVDFFGQPLPPLGAIVGPFQQLKEGSNELKLWP